jgi:hypothetical protein
MNEDRLAWFDPPPTFCDPVVNPSENEVPHSNQAFVFELFGFTEPWSVAPFWEIPVAEFVSTLGADPDPEPEECVVKERTLPQFVPKLFCATARK